MYRAASRAREVLVIADLGPCLEWQGYRNEHGYGRLRRDDVNDGKAMLAHRRAWEEERGPIPKGVNVLHRCDNPPCIRVAHLFLGTQSENVADMEAKGRRRWLALSRERNGNARISEAQVEGLRLDYRRGARQVDLAEQYGISQSQVSNIVRGVHWG